MDRAYEGDATRQLVLDLEMVPVVPPKSNCLEPLEYDKEMYKRRNEVERLFRRLAQGTLGAVKRCQVVMLCRER